MNKPLLIQSPWEIDQHLRRLLLKLELIEAEAVHLEYTSPNSFEPELANCHFNVWLKLKIDGGSVQPGWILAQDKTQPFSEAIFHSVWISPSGRLIDITPRVDGEKKVLFIPDHRREIQLSQHLNKPAIVTIWECSTI